MNDVECEHVPTRVFNPNASEASHKPKQRRYRKTKLKKNLAPDSPGAQMFSAQTAAPKSTQPHPNTLDRITFSHKTIRLINKVINCFEKLDLFNIEKHATV